MKIIAMQKKLIEKEPVLNVETFDPNKMFDTVIEKLSLRNDAALCRWVGVGPPVISKMRHGKLSVGASMLIRLHEISDISIKELRTLMGDDRERFYDDTSALPTQRQ